MSLIRLFRYLQKRDVAFALVSVVFIVCQVGLELKMPDYMNEITHLVETPGSAMTDVLCAGAAMLACALGSLVSSLAVGFFVARIAAGLAMRLRAGAFDRVLDFTMEDLAGFSTASLITRCTNDATQGAVLVDGVDVRELGQAALRDRLGYVPQRSVLLSGTVRSNVSYGETGRDDRAHDAVARAIQIAQAADFVDEMEGGLDAPIAQDGTNVSGGQKQRLSIARAVCRDLEVYLFDDSFSALDYKTDRALRKALDEQAADSTVLIVAQRISAVAGADKILVLDEGRLVGEGTHDELLSTCEVYRQIAESQLTEEELQDVR